MGRLNPFEDRRPEAYPYDIRKDGGKIYHFLERDGDDFAHAIEYDWGEAQGREVLIPWEDFDKFQVVKVNLKGAPQKGKPYSRIRP